MGPSSLARRPVKLAAVVVASSTAPLALLGACGLTADFSGLQGGAGDAGIDTAITVEATPGDEGEVGAPVEASGAVDGGFCAMQKTPVKLCADFDEGKKVGAGWTSTDVWQGQYISVDNVYYSAPGSFLSSINQNAAPASARLQEDLPLDAQTIHVEFEMLLPSVSGNFEICTLHEQTPDGTTYGVFYKYQSGKLLIYMRTLADDGGEIDVVNQIGPPSSGWMHVAIDYVVGNPGSIRVTHDGQVVVDDTSLDTTTNGRTSMFVELGYYSDAPANALAHFDNVIIDWL